MASFIAPRYPPPESSLVRGRRVHLNAIIEEESSDEVALLRNTTYNPSGDHQRQGAQFTKRAAPPTALQIESMLSPRSDHFPTPRGIHYIAAPRVPGSPSTATPDSSPTTNSSHQWNRSSIMSAATEFEEDLYDVSDREDEHEEKLAPVPISRRASVSQKPVPAPTRLIIPQQHQGVSIPDDTWSARSLKKLASSPMPLTPSAQLTMSPAQMTFMDQQQALEVPTISAPPSLDGSLSSEQLAAMSAPPTPVIGHDDDEAADAEEMWSGIQLQPGALATLQALAGGNDDDQVEPHPERVIELDSPMQQAPEMRQQPLRLLTNFQPRAATMPADVSASPARSSLADLTRLEIPSPGGFFAGLSPRARHTWHQSSQSPADFAPPTSTTAEQFYKCPWNEELPAPPVPRPVAQLTDFSAGVSSSPVERIVELYQSDDEDDLPTAKPILPKEPEAIADQAPPSPDNENAATEIVADVDPKYAQKQQQEALSHLDRTELWLQAQRAYLKGVDNQNEVVFGLSTVMEDPEEAEDKRPEAQSEPDVESLPVARKKTVRFSDISVSSVKKPIKSGPPAVKLPSKLKVQESAYYRAFQDCVVRSHARDAFVHQLPRFEALQAQRVSLPEKHRNQLLGKYQLSVVPQSAKKRLSANVARGDDTIVDDPEKIRQDREYEATTQTTAATWQVAAVKLLNGGRLVSAPVAKRLNRLSFPASKTKRDRLRILDLGGQATCDWAWHCALQFPNAKVYTVTTKAIRQLSNANIRGPSNHRQVAVERLTRLPFEDSQFDLISARELQSILKMTGENGIDEWEVCLQECQRILKPGGFIEFSVQDSDIMNAGPLGLAKSVEFGFALKTLGYDPSPSKMWLGRLHRAGFTNVRRAWSCLPMGPKQNPFRAPTPPLKDGPRGEAGQTVQMEAMVMGSSNAIAGAASLVGCLNWERWILRCEMEKVAGELRLADTVTSSRAMDEAAKALEGVHAVIEEGRNCNAGFRVLTGYAQKPVEGTEEIQIGMAGL